VSSRIPVLVHADDPVSRSGVEAQLRGQPGIEVRLHDGGGEAGMPHGAVPVAIVVVDEVDDRAARSIRALTRGGVDRVLVVAGRLDDAAVLTVTEAGACGLLRRAEAVPERLVPAIRSARRRARTLGGRMRARGAGRRASSRVGADAGGATPPPRHGSPCSPLRRRPAALAGGRHTPLRHYSAPERRGLATRG